VSSSPPEVAQPIRRLAAILIADVAGYSRLMERDEDGTHARLREVRAQVTDPAIARRGGRIVRTAGDGMLVEFQSAVEALSCAVEIQREMAARNEGLAPDSRIDFRMGINLGDIIIDGGDIAGEGVNLAARLETLAPPGGIALSRAVREQVRQVVGVTLNDAGLHRVKNISHPIRVYTVDPASASIQAKWRRSRRWPRWASLVAVAALVGALAVAALQIRWTPAPPPMSLVVVPFANLSGVAAEDALTERVTAELTNAMARASGVTVIAPSLARRYAGQQLDAQSLGRELNVRYTIEGSLTAAGEKLRVAAMLSSTESGSQVWSDTIEVARDSEPVPLELIGRLADTVRLQLRNAELRRLDREDANDAFALSLRAHVLHPSAVTDDQVRRVHALYEQAVRKDPKHVAALEGLAYALAVDADRSHDDAERNRLLQRAEELSAQSIAHGPNDAEAWGTRSVVLWFAGKRAAAMEAIERALVLNPYFAELHGQHGLLLMDDGKTEAALAAFERAIRLHPTSDVVGVHLNARCRALLYLGRYADAIDACQRATSTVPDWPDYMLLAAAYAMAGDLQHAAQAREELLKMEPRFTIGWLRAKQGNVSARTAQQREQHLFAGLRKAGVPE
jgi:class 3 adenylate cyclase/TolB-like protein/cytochrome c-type biogenesis protein CcmH/NrfG